jgi:FKBP-type peptidyl-prolyl cis-trans isomerase
MIKMIKSLKIVFSILVMSVVVFTACNPTGKLKKSKKEVNPYSMSFDVPDSVSYAIGMSMASYLERQGISSIEVESYSNGMKAGMEMGEAPKPIVDSIGGIIQEFMSSYSSSMTEKMAADSTFVPEPMGLPENISYNYGLLLGTNLVSQNLNKSNLDILVNGVKDHFGGTPKVALEASGSTLQGYFDLTDSLRGNLNQQYLDDNKMKEGIVTTVSGLQYKVIVKGTEKTPSEEDKVSVHYKGMFIDGSVFDSSYDRGGPAAFVLNQVIPGWTEGLALMPVCSKYIFVIPYGLGYGEQGSRSIPPKSTLIFEVELLEIVK